MYNNSIGKTKLKGFTNRNFLVRINVKITAKILKHILKNMKATKNVAEKETVLYLSKDVAAFSTKKVVSNKANVNTPNGYIDMTSKDTPAITPTHRIKLFFLALVDSEFLLKKARRKTTIKTKLSFAL